MKTINVYFDWNYLPEINKIGSLRTDVIRGSEVFSFEYDRLWLEGSFSQTLDPDLDYYPGSQYLQNKKVNFGMFLDSSPDRWGRMLMNRKEAIDASNEKRPQKTLLESDYLLGLDDATRMGALRFKLDENSDFLSNNENIEVPPISNIRELEQACNNVEKDEFFENENAGKWLKILFAPGSSLGGARPKANIYNTDRSLWIAKFPSKNDNIDTGAWEYIVNKMAKDLNINVATGKAQKFLGNRHTYLTKRFDRSNGKRLHYASAMTLLGLIDGKNDIGYLDIVKIIEKYGSSPTKDIRELWRRIVFSVAISNTDDHLRNHGFLLTPSGWELSPAFDINPISDGMGLSLNIDDNNNNSLDFDLCLEVIGYFRVNENEAVDFIVKTKEVVSQWKRMAKTLNVPSTDISLMERAFNI
ncbi:MAG: HipA domain-containing protein [Candidatus Marinimicrobia bacterium]|nr:HipA domain-containing protein [Candidatus Neomarinimicrobiota bacterium]